MSRPFETDYAGAWRGYCKTRESAIIAAMRHVAQDGYTRCTITDRRTGEVVARVSVALNRLRAAVEVVHPFPRKEALQRAAAKTARIAAWENRHAA